MDAYQIALICFGLQCLIEEYGDRTHHMRYFDYSYEDLQAAVNTAINCPPGKLEEEGIDEVFIAFCAKWILIKRIDRRYNKPWTDGYLPHNVHYFAHMIAKEVRGQLD